MKKYLMMGAAALLMGASFTSCSSDNDLYDPQANATKFLQAYESTFIEVFGTPAANQTWGFGEAPATSRMTRTVNMNGNMWEDCPTLGETEAQDVFNYVNMTRYAMKHATPEHKFTEEFPENIENYFVTHVYKGSDTYTNADGGGNIKGSDHMDNLHIKELEAGSLNRATGQLSETGWYHVNDFNSGESTDFGGNTLVLESGTLDFAYYSSEDSKYHNRWIAVNGADIDPKYAGYYYICFDFEAYYTDPTNAQTTFQLNFQVSKPDGNGGTQTDNVSAYVEINGFYKTADAIVGSGFTTYNYNGTNIEVTPNMISNIRVINGNMYVAPNDVYTDWIIRLVAAQPADEPQLPSLRVIAEDLTVGEKGDFDFNDVVFDAEYVDANNVKVTIQAAGGTLPLTVYGQEVHELFKNANPDATTDQGGEINTMTMINTNARFVNLKEGSSSAELPKKPSFNITDKSWSNDPNTFAEQVRDNIKVYVTKYDDEGQALSPLELTAERGKTPGKVAVGITYQWKDERVYIGENFKKFVSDPTYAMWWKE